MTSLSAAILAAIAVTVSALDLSAQESIQLETGARVRLISPALPASERVVSIVSTASDTVVFRPVKNPVTRRLALSQISAIDLSKGQRRNTRKGALYGLAAGIGIGAALGYATYEACDGRCLLGPTTPGGSALWGAMVGGVTGVVTGTAFGFFTRSETWQRIKPDTGGNASSSSDATRR